MTIVHPINSNTQNKNESSNTALVERLLNRQMGDAKVKVDYCNPDKNMWLNAVVIVTLDFWN